MDEQKLPRHVAFIMDGNGRWAKKRGKPRWYGHKVGYKALENIIDYSFNRGIEVVSFYAFSTENWSRPKDEVLKLMALLKRGLKAATPKLFKEKVRLTISGDISVVKESVKKDLFDVVEKTKRFTEHTVNICFNYGSRAEIVRAINNIIAEGLNSVNEETFSKYLYTSDLPDPDLVIRTSGEQRLSNFLLWQSAYSELYFTPTAWPDFDGEQLELALDWYFKRDRRFGKI